MNAASLTGRFELFVASGVLAAHASGGDQGFRPRDVRFFAELFFNWVGHSIGEDLLLQNTQISRYLGDLVDEGFLRKVKTGSFPHFRLSRVGLIELLTRLTSGERSYPREYFFFLLFFLEGYGSRLEELVKREGSQFPPSLRVELQALLDVETLVTAEIRRTERELKKIESRIDDANRISALIRKGMQGGLPFSELVKEVEERFPYEFNSRKPLVELIGSLVADQRVWELETGSLLRAKLIWTPQIEMLRQYLQRLKRISLKE